MPTIFQIITQAFATYKTRFNDYLQPVVMYILATVIFYLIINPLTATEGNVVPVIILFAIYLLINIWLVAVIMILTNTILNNQPVELNKIYAIAYKKSPKYVWYSLVVGLIVIGGTILVILPGIYFSIKYAFTAMQTIFEESIPTLGQSLNNSAEMVKGRWWMTLWRLAIPVIFYSFVMLFIMIIVSAIVAPGLTDPSVLEANIYYNLFANILNGLLLPLTVIPSIIVYRSYKTSKV